MKYCKYILFSFLICFMAVLEVFASTENVYMLEDLTTSKTVLNGSKIIVGDYYPNGVIVEYDGVKHNLEKNSTFTLGNGNDESCYVMSKLEKSYIAFSKATCKSYDIPSLANDYTISYNGLYKWYKVRDVSVSTDGFVKELNEYVGVNGSFKVDFTANKGEILFFKLKNMVVGDSLLEIVFDGEKIPVGSNEILFKNMYLRAGYEGDHTLIISYINQNDSYVLVKNFMLLTEYGNEKKLNTFGISNRDRIYYEVIDRSIVGDGIIYYLNNEVLDSDPFVDDNPNTVDAIYIVLSLLVVVLFSLGFSIYKVNRTQKYKVHEEIE